MPINLEPTFTIIADPDGFSAVTITPRRQGVNNNGQVTRLLALSPTVRHTALFWPMAGSPTSSTVRLTPRCSASMTRATCVGMLMAARPRPAPSFYQRDLQRHDDAGYAFLVAAQDINDSARSSGCSKDVGTTASLRSTDDWICDAARCAGSGSERSPRASTTPGRSSLYQPASMHAQLRV